MSGQKMEAVEDNICRQCFTAGNVTVVETLPYGFAMQCIHDGGIKHTWTRYKSLEVIGQRKKGEPITIRCPTCGKRGKVSFYRSNPYRTDRVAYVIRHERIKGTWGKGKIQKYRRCYVRDKEGKAYISSKLDKNQ